MEGGMKTLETGDLVVLISGSMRMAVEAVEDSTVRTVWCHEGVIGRDSFDARLLRKWEVNEAGEHRSPPRGRPRAEATTAGMIAGIVAGSWRRPRQRPRWGQRRRPGWRQAPRGKPGWDGKPREKKYFRKD
jgi:hypothetical protein